MADWLPVISQLKSLFQLIGGDKEGAKRTQINFSKQCPGVSQVRSLVEYGNGDGHAARQTQKEFLGTVSDVLDTVPAVGHVKGVGHYAAGDKDGGDNAMKESSRTVGVAVGAAGGFAAGGPLGSVAGGVAGGLIMDAVTTKVDSEVHGHYRPAGYIQQIGELKKDPTNPGKLFDTVFSIALDGWSGHTDGRQKAKNPTHVKNQRSSNIQLHGTDFSVGINPVCRLHDTTNDYTDHNQNLKRQIMDKVPYLFTDVNCESEDEQNE